MRLPNADCAIVDIEKLTHYCLNPEHPRGRHKARVFAEALGITSDNAESLRMSILDAAVEFEAHATRKDRFGRRYVIDFPMETKTGRAMIRTSWIILDGEDVPRLTTCFVT